MLNLFYHELFSRRGAISGWGIGLALYGTLYIAIYPQMAEQLSVLGSIPLYQSLGMSMGTLEGYLASSVVQFFPVILAIYVVISSTSTLVGEEESGTLEMLLATPLNRWQIISVKALALSVVSLLIMTIAAFGSAITFAFVKTVIVVDISVLQLFVAILSGWPVLMAFLMMGLFFAAFLPTRRAASMALTVVILISYFGKMLAISFPSFKGIKALFLFTYFDTSPTIFARGITFENNAPLFALAAIFFVLAVFSFQYRDITVGLWPWQRAKHIDPIDRS